VDDKYYVVEAWSTDPDGLRQVYFVKSELRRDLFVSLITFASPIKALRLIATMQVTEWYGKESYRPARHFATVDTLLDPRVFLDDAAGVYWSLLDLRDAQALAQDWMATKAYSEARKEVPQGVYFKNRVDSFVGKIEARWPEEPSREKKRGQHGRRG
jgi:hypothetical protein